MIKIDITITQYNSFVFKQRKWVSGNYEIGSRLDLFCEFNKRHIYFIVVSSSMNISNVEMFSKNLPISVTDIYSITCKYFNIVPVDNEKPAEYTKIRQISHYLSRELTLMPYRYIGYKIGNKKHATVMFSCSQTKAFIKNEKEYKKTVYKIKKLCTTFVKSF
jgi:chromosomal replication initiation ATPase DnaA